MGTNVTSNTVIAAVLLIRIAGCAVAELVDKTLNRRNRTSLLVANALTAGLMVANCLAISFAARSIATGLPSLTACATDRAPDVL